MSEIGIGKKRGKIEERLRNKESREKIMTYETSLLIIKVV
jgi:hypothetical protein